MSNDKEITIDLRSKYGTMEEINRNIYSPLLLLAGMFIDHISTTNNNYTYNTRKEDKG